jgi:hypothetical protein
LDAFCKAKGNQEWNQPDPANIMVAIDDCVIRSGFGEAVGLSEYETTENKEQASKSYR